MQGASSNYFGQKLCISSEGRLIVLLHILNICTTLGQTHLPADLIVGFEDTMGSRNHVRCQ
jgi:hypothetical protein